MTQKIPSSTLANQTRINAVSGGAVNSPAAILSGYWGLDQTLTGSINGNAGTATTLQTSRNINGVTFNGSQDITVGLNTTTTNSSGTYYVPFVPSNSSLNQQASVNGSLSYNPSNGTLSLGSGAINASNLPSSSTIGANVSIAANASVSGTNTGDQNLSGYALLSGATFSGAISANNLSGTNTGDQNLSGYALLSGATFSGAISANNLSGTNTGDQNLSGYAPLANPNFTGSITLSNGSGDGLYLGEDSTNTYWGLWNKNVDPAAQPVNYENDYIIINNGSSTFINATLGGSINFAIGNSGATVTIDRHGTQIGGTGAGNIVKSDPNTYALTTAVDGTDYLSPTTGVASSAFSSSLGATSGYQKLPGGMIIQWGQIAPASLATEHDFLPQSFPTAFPNACVSVTATIWTQNNVGLTDEFAAVYSFTASGFDLYGGSTISGTRTYGILWMAIGF